MRSYLSILGLLASTAGVNAQHIEPVMIPIVNAESGINIQMGKYEVTVEEYKRFIASTGYEVPKKCMLFSPSSWPDPETPANWDHPELVANSFNPVSCIGVKGAKAYARWLSEVTGKPYRLPQLHEWQYAASKGKHSRFDFGEDYSQTEICKYENTEDFASVAGILRDHGHRYDISAQCNDGAVYQTVVGMYRPNSLGLFDMMGNVRELQESCVKWDNDQSENCLEYDVAGEAWHWQARGVKVPDTILADFYGSIEGFRLVLDSTERYPISKQTEIFLQELDVAQKKARKTHEQMMTLPNAPKHVTGTIVSDTQTRIEWQETQPEAEHYSVYRSYLDPNGEHSRDWQKVADKIKTNFYVDNLAGNGFVSYKVYAINNQGESPASRQAQLGNAPVFLVDQKIEAEQYFAEKFTWIQDKDDASAVGFMHNPKHYVTGQFPFLPAWLKFAFTSKKSGTGMIEVRVRGEDGATFEIWQGHHLVARISLSNQEGFANIRQKASWIEGDYPLEIRAANQKWFMLDWLILKP
ncbi:formylglycine-generating enzyme family protein [Alteromonas sp. 009811495]|uniref:formylglycine-generating enzyme family protein n=1 Tax=Alteromonas sp. 009811495 TaxID=3002962 RepID=UPI00237E69FE|nr:SUMF1/EgtB/PvdO family nonheme iron enzyme [Alteromonas sp. 009811495]WDT86905.1 SUMF1/EgtB/PvdO family nonheme iron enzyme [Alteromonas sp. 009811495]